MMCKYYGKTLSMEHIAKYCKTSSEGISLLGISEGASKLGLQTYAARVTLEQLSKVSAPCILYWDQSHFVVLYKIKKEKNFISPTLHVEKRFII